MVVVEVESLRVWAVGEVLVLVYFIFICVIGIVVLLFVYGDGIGIYVGGVLKDGGVRCF